MKEDKTKGFVTIAEERLQDYAKTVARRYELTDRLLYAVREGNEYQVLKMIQEWNSLPLPGRLEDELTEWKYDLVQIKSLIIQELRRCGVMDLLLENLNTEFTQRIHAAASAGECREIAELMALRLCGTNSLREMRDYSFLVQKIILAVDMDLTQTLTLQYFSETLNVNRSYLSDLFRREVGTTVTDYVTERRVRMAADLLLTTQDPIKTVAKRVGIMDVHYFSRLFKRKMGKAPSQYREQR